MANNQPKANRNQMVVDLTGRGGLAHKYYGDINRFGFTGDQAAGQPQYRYNVGDNEMASGIYNPLRKNGYLSPAVGTIYNFSSAPSNTSLVGATIYDSINDKSYLFTYTGGSTFPLYRLDGIDSETLQTDRTMPGGTTFGGDLEIYQIDGVRTLFYSYRTGSAWRVGVKNLTTSGFTDNWLGSGGSVSGTFEPSSNGEMKFVNSGDGFMYILNANSIHRVDGTTLGGSTGRVFRDLLKAPDYFRFTHGVDHRNNLYFAIQKITRQETHNIAVSSNPNFTTECGVYIWNRQATFFNSSDFVPIQGVREIRALYVSPKNDIRCITISNNGATQIRKYNGTTFEVIKELGTTAYPNFADSLTIVNGFTCWMGYDGNIYYHGSEMPGEQEFLFIMGSVGGTGIQNVLGGSILYGGGTGYSTNGTLEKPNLECFVINYTISSVAKISRFFPYANGSLTGGVTTSMIAHAGNVYTGLKLFPPLSTIHNMKVFMARETGLSAGVSDATLNFYKNGDTTAFISKTVTTDDIMKGYKSIEINTPFIDTLQISISYAATAITDKRFCPNFALVEYTPTSTNR